MHELAAKFYRPEKRPVLWEFRGTVYGIMLLGAKLFSDKSEKLISFSALDTQHTIHVYDALISKCVPVLTSVLQ
jgi:hypothetical protein